MMTSLPSILTPRSPDAHAIYRLTIGVLLLCAAIFILVVSLVTYACIKFRQKKNQAEPPPIYGNRQLETMWTLIPLLALVLVMVFTVRTMIEVSPPDFSKNPDVVVIGHQWWWEVRYPFRRTKEVITANEIHIPVRKRLRLELRAADVIHDFWVPDLERKVDAIPGHPNQIWLEADQPGTYLGVCAEFCGASHAWMQIRVVAEETATYQAWLEKQALPAIRPVDEPSKRGLALFRENTCMNCHRISGVSSAVQLGPDLTHLGSRKMLAAGALENNPANLARWLEGPGRVKPGAHMTVYPFKEGELADLVSFLESLK